MIPYRYLRRIFPAGNPPVSEKHKGRPTTSHLAATAGKIIEIALFRPYRLDIDYEPSP